MQLSSLTNRLLHWRHKKLPRDLFWELAQNHISFLYHVAYKYAGNRFDAEDLVQEVLAIGFKQFHQLRNTEKFRSWMFTILRHAYLKEQRHSAPMAIDEYENGLDYLVQLEDSTSDLDVSHAYEKKVEAELVQTILNRLPEKFKSVLILYYMQDHSYQDISEILAIPIGTVMSRLFRAKQAMKKALLRQRLKQAQETHIPRNPMQ